MNSSATKLIFVYGTLKRGCRNHRELAGQSFVSEARTAPGFRLYHLGEYPGMVAVPSDREGVSGEVWAVSAEGLARLDRFEGVNEGLYRRVPIPLLAPFAEKSVDAYLYEPPVGNAPDIGGTWTE